MITNPFEKAQEGTHAAQAHRGTSAPTGMSVPCGSDRDILAALQGLGAFPTCTLSYHLHGPKPTAYWA